MLELANAATKWRGCGVAGVTWVDERRVREEKRT